jgi:hypothetical protein
MTPIRASIVGLSDEVILPSRRSHFSPFTKSS